MQDSFLSWYNMAKEPASTENMATEQAMATALEAEHESLQSIAECEAEAEQILEQARQAAHHISERADSRITRIHQSCNRIATDEVNRLQRSSEHKINDAKNPQPDKKSVIHAVTVLVESLTTVDEVTGNTDSSS
jgi:vacuolar-type H+-ATPase subunit E/Vma4